MILPRRRLFGIGAAFVATPAIVRVGSIMPVSVVADSVSMDEAIRQIANIVADPSFAIDKQKFIVEWAIRTQETTMAQIYNNQRTLA